MAAGNIGDTSYSHPAAFHLTSHWTSQKLSSLHGDLNVAPEKAIIKGTLLFTTAKQFKRGGLSCHLAAFIIDLCSMLRNCHSTSISYMYLGLDMNWMKTSLVGSQIAKLKKKIIPGIGLGKTDNPLHERCVKQLSFGWSHLGLHQQTKML